MPSLRQIVDLVRVASSWKLAAQLRQRRRARRPGRVHVLFCLCDHFEPGTGGVDARAEGARVDDLVLQYPILADAHRDSEGRRPTRTWFFPPHYHRAGSLGKLAGLCARGYGEVELHLHHGKHVPDDAANLRRTLELCLEEYGRFGIFGQSGGQRRYGFIHGDWALDNSRHGRYCGVNDEITILQQTGCYADFTFPCFNEANPRQINAIYYAHDDPARPKSHDRGRALRVGRDGGAEPGLMIVEGPLHPHRLRGSWRSLRLVGDAIDRSAPTSAARVARWIQSGICVAGREDWIVVKTHTHGATDAPVVLGPGMHEIFGHLEAQCRDRDGWALHYVTARELYNIIKAAEAGEPGDDPAAYRDYLISPPAFDPAGGSVAASAQLEERIGRTYRG